MRAGSADCAGCGFHAQRPWERSLVRVLSRPVTALPPPAVARIEPASTGTAPRSESRQSPGPDRYTAGPGEVSKGRAAACPPQHDCQRVWHRRPVVSSCAAQSARRSRGRNLSGQLASALPTCSRLRLGEARPGEGGLVNTIGRAVTRSDDWKGGRRYSHGTSGRGHSLRRGGHNQVRSSMAGVHRQGAENIQVLAPSFLLDSPIPSPSIFR